MKKQGLPFADIAPPVTHPATTVFVVSCFARACEKKDSDDRKKNETHMLNVNVYSHSPNSSDLLNNTLSS